MTFAEYDRLASRTAANATLLHLSNALAGEVGEVCGEVKKYYENGGGDPALCGLTALVDELGDALWYLNEMAKTVGYTLEEVARWNVRKLEARYGLAEDTEDLEDQSFKDLRNPSSKDPKSLSGQRPEGL